jgi:hypothetical protein
MPGSFRLWLSANGCFSVVKIPPRITVFPPECPHKIAGFRPPQETAAIALQRPISFGSGPRRPEMKTHPDLGGQNRRAYTRYFSKMSLYNRLSDGPKIRAFYGVFRMGLRGIRGCIERILEVGKYRSGPGLGQDSTRGNGDIEVKHHGRATSGGTRMGW